MPRVAPLLVLFTLALPPLAAKETKPTAPAPAAPAREPESRWVFSLLPKSLQKNPRMEMTVVTEMTDAGRKLPPVSAAQPAYIHLFSSGYHVMGDGARSTPAINDEVIRRFLVRSLATNGYLPEQTPQHPPSLLVLYTWGAHTLLFEGDEENPSLSGNAIAKNMLDRAALVGGAKFAEKLAELFRKADDMAIPAWQPPPDPTGQVEAFPPVMTQAMLDFANPIAMYKRLDPKNEYLVDQAANDVYYVVASAYDYASAAKGGRLLLWRTRMTVNASGISEEQGLPALVLAAAPFFGKDMPEAEILSRRPVPVGTVEVGTPRVVEDAPRASR